VKKHARCWGHPLLVQACQDAVKEWKFVPAPERARRLLNLSFMPISGNS